MSIKSRLTRMAADDVYTLITNADINDVARALEETLQTDVQIYDDPWDIAREYMDTEWVVDQYLARAQEAVDVMRKAVNADPDKIIEVDRYDGDKQQAFSVAEAKAYAAEMGIDVDSDDMTEVCRALNDAADEDAADVRYVCPAVIDEVGNKICEDAVEAGASDGDWRDNANDYLYEYGVDKNAEYVVYVEDTKDDTDFYNCADKDELVNLVIKLVGGDTLKFMAALQRG